MGKRSAAKQEESLVPGYWVALCLRPNTAPQRVYVGQVQAVDRRGVRVTLRDVITGGAHGYDFFAPWSSIASFIVATPEHDVERFHIVAETFQAAMERPSAKTPPVAATPRRKSIGRLATVRAFDLGQDRATPRSRRRGRSTRRTPLH